MADKNKNVGHLAPIENNRLSNIGPVELGQDGIDYAKTALAEGGLISLNVEKLFSNASTCFAPMEERSNVERAKKFDVGSSMPTVAIRKWLADYIVKQWGNDAQLMFSDPWRKTGDVEHASAQPYFSIAKRLYLFPQAGDIYARLSEGAKRLVTWPFVAYVIKPSVPVPPSGVSMTQEYAKLVAHNTQAVLVSAYDREGYVVWEKE